MSANHIGPLSALNGQPTHHHLRNSADKPARAVMPLALFLWEKEVGNKFVLNDAAQEVIEFGVRTFREICSTITGQPWVSDRELDTIRDDRQVTEQAEAEAGRPACKKCRSTDAPRLQWQECYGGRMKHIRESCNSCGSFRRFAPKTPANVASASQTPPFEGGGR